MSTLKLLLTNPKFSHLEFGPVEWVIFGTHPEIATDSVERSDTVDDVLTKLESIPGEYSFLRLTSDAEVHGYRGITSSYDLYYTRESPEADLIVSDHLRNIIATLPLDRRTVPESVAADQLLFGTRPQGTYLDEVKRVGHGEQLVWDGRTEPVTELRDTLSVTETLSRSEALRELDDVFSEILADQQFSDSTVTMLSGGVDSTLIQSYLGTDTSVSAAVNSEEFDFERGYANNASRLLGTNHQLQQISEPEFVEWVEKTTDATGHPLQHLQATLMYASVSETPHQEYLNGQLADGVFGTGTAAISHLARYLVPVRNFLPDVSALGVLKEASEQLSVPSVDPDGLAMNFVIHSDQQKVSKMVGKDTIDQRKQRRLKYTRKRIDIAEQPGYADHMHLGHLIDFFQDNTVTPWRHAAHAEGKMMHTPFADRTVIETVLKLPPSKRYTRFAKPSTDDPTLVVKNKYLLKELLQQRNPEYNVRKQKGSSALPLERYFETGPLADAFEKYPLPDFIPDHMTDTVRDGADHVTWYAFSYAVWRDRILETEDIPLFESTDVIQR